MNVRKPMLVISVAAFLAGCQGNGVSLDQSKAATQPFPSNYKQIIAQELRSRLFDPYSVRDAGITAPKWGVVGPIYGEQHFVCVRFNAKNRLGGYVGVEHWTYAWNNGEKIARRTYIVCPDMNYLPFPELGNPK